ncbi:MAG: ferrous iron transport protein A [Kiritimatiellae bacterium]|nr:ferrous iron transport protein A [Kiritimatiellia bacterium]MBQ9344506.1 ferrous iron transport protein A [Kiritimatiellia bacterium]
MQPLVFGKPGEKVRVLKITGTDKVRLHLAELGFVVDAVVTVVSEDRGNMIVEVKDTRIALGRDLALRIMI